MGTILQVHDEIRESRRVRRGDRDCRSTRSKNGDPHRSARCFSVVLVILMCDRNRAQVGVIHCAGCKALSKIAGEAGGCHFNVWPNKHGLEVGARASKPRWPARVRAACNKHVRVAEVEKERLRVKVVLCLLHPELSRIDELRTNPLGAATDLDGLGVDDHLDRGAGPTGLQRFQEGVLGVEERSCDHHAPGRRRDRVAELFAP